MLPRAARLFCAIPIAATLLPLSTTGRAWVRIWDFPRIHLAALSALAMMVTQRSKGSPIDRLLTAALAGCCAYQAAKILPYTPLYRKQVLRAKEAARDRRLRLLTYNVYMENRRSAEVLRMIAAADADAICLLEPDAWWEEQMRPLEREYPYTNKCPLGNTYGMLLYSRLPLTSETRFLVQEDIPSMRSIVRLRSGDEIVLYTLHPRPPVPPEPSYGRDAELVLIGSHIAREDRPAIVLGDLNDVAWSYTTTLFQRISGTLDPRIGRGLYNSFHAKSPAFRFPLDHVFHTPDFTLLELRRLDRCGSDHFPILIELAHEPRRAAAQDAPEVQPGDRENAQEIVEDATENGAVTSPESPLA